MDIYLVIMIVCWKIKKGTNFSHRGCHFAMLLFLFWKSRATYKIFSFPLAEGPAQRAEIRGERRCAGTSPTVYEWSRVSSLDHITVEFSGERGEGGSLCFWVVVLSLEWICSWLFFLQGSVRGWGSCMFSALCL